MGYVLRWLGIGVSTVVFTFLAFLALPLGVPALTWVARTWSLTNLWLCGVKVVVEAPPVPLDAVAYVAMATHSSHFDVMAVFGHAPINMRPVAKRELGYIPLFGWVLVAGAAIMIDRRNRRRAVASIRKAGALIRSGSSVLMFPEGTRTPSGVVGPLKKGAFHLALEAQVPVLPIGVEGAGEILAPHDWKIRPGTIHMRVGTPIATKGLSNDEAGRRALMASVEAALVELSHGRPASVDVRGDVA